MLLISGIKPPLLFATHSRNHQVVEFLLSKGADVNIRDIDW